MWQSQAWAGAFSFGASVPEENGTRYSSARLSTADIPLTAARVASPVFLIKLRRSAWSLVMVLLLRSPRFLHDNYCSAGTPSPAVLRSFAPFRLPLVLLVCV